MIQLRPTILKNQRNQTSLSENLVGCSYSVHQINLSEKDFIIQLKQERQMLDSFPLFIVIGSNKKQKKSFSTCSAWVASNQCFTDTSKQ